MPTQRPDKVVFEPIREPHKALPYWDWFANSRFFARYPIGALESAFGQVLNREAIAIVGFLNGEAKGFVIIKPKQEPHPTEPKLISVCEVVQIYGYRYLYKFRDEFFSWLKGFGYEKLRGYSNAQDKAFEKLFDMTKIYSVYEKEF